MSSAKTGEELILVGRVLKEGRTLAFLESDIIREKDNRLLMRGKQTKFL